MVHRIPAPLYGFRSMSNSLTQAVPFGQKEVARFRTYSVFPEMGQTVGKRLRDSFGLGQEKMIGRGREHERQSKALERMQTCVENAEIVKFRVFHSLRDQSGEGLRRTQ